MRRISLIFTLLAACHPAPPGAMPVPEAPPPQGGLALEPSERQETTPISQAVATNQPKPPVPTAAPDTREQDRLRQLLARGAEGPAAGGSAKELSGTLCQPFNMLAHRREGDLLVRSPPSKHHSSILGRMRSHVRGGMRKGTAREWVGPPVPDFLPLYEGSAELNLLERSADDFVAVYRDPYGAGSCALSSSRNCKVVAVAYDHCGKQQWSRTLNDVMSRPDQLEVQDLRVADGIVYFNEACQSYSRAAQRKCSSLLAYDPIKNKVLWRTNSLVSNNRFLIVDDLVVTGYGFTSEPDHLFLVRRKDGKVLFRKRLPTAHEDIRSEGGKQITVQLYSGPDQRLELQGTQSARPRLVPRRQ